MKTFKLLITFGLSLANTCFAANTIKDVMGPKNFIEGKDLVKVNWTNKITYETLDRGVTVHIAHYPYLTVITYLDGENEGQQTMLHTRKGEIFHESAATRVEKQAVIHAYAKWRVYTNEFCQYLLLESAT